MPALRESLRTLVAALATLSLAACGAGAIDGPDSDDAADGVGYDVGEVVAACGARLAPTGATASTSDANVPRGAIDGNAATRWSGFGSGAYLTVDLGATKTLCGLSIQWYRGAERTNAFTVSVSTDGTGFKQVYSGSSDVSAATQNYTVTTSAARYVRVTVFGNSQNDWASINELQINEGRSSPGVSKPGASTTGVPAGVTLKPYNTSGADLVITQDGTVLDGLDIFGDIKVRARNVVIRRSKLRGGKGIPRSNTGIVDSNSAAVKNLLVEDCTITPDRPSYYRDGIVGHDYTSRRNHISRTNDGLGIFNVPGGSPQANVLVEANYIHTLTHFSEDPAHSDGTHNDCIQVQGGENIRIVGNNIDCDAVEGAGSTPNARTGHAGQGILLQQNVAALANVEVTDNWLDDAGATVSINHSPQKGYTSITATLRNNRFGRNQYDYGNGSKYPLRIYSRSASKVIGVNQPGNETNRWMDTGALLTEGRNTGIRVDVE